MGRGERERRGREEAGEEGRLKSKVGIFTSLKVLINSVPCMMSYLCLPKVCHYLPIFLSVHFLKALYLSVIMISFYLSYKLLLLSLSLV